jgi:hypothetical protein
LGLNSCGKENFEFAQEESASNEGAVLPLKLAVMAWYIH